MRVLPLALIAAAALPGAAAAAAPPVVPGWPIPGFGGELLPGPRGGVVEVDRTARIVAFDPAARRLWQVSDPPDCGNCESLPAEFALQRDGTYGPFGFAGEIWAVDARGRRTAACSGAVLADGTCVTTLLSWFPQRRRVEVMAVRGTTRAWSHVEPDLEVYADFTDVAPTVADDAGSVYTALPAGTTSAGAPAPARLLALDAATGVVRGRAEGRFTIVGALASGVLVWEEDRLAAYSATGARSWILDGPPPALVTSVRIDARRGRAYLSERRRATPWRPVAVTAIDTVAGRILWRTAPADRARALTVGASGRVLLATERAGYPAVRAVSPAGRGIWSRGVGAPATGAAETASGRVAIGAGGMTLLVDPRRTAASTPTRLGLSLHHRRVRSCVDLGRDSARASVSAAACPILRVAAPRPTRLVVRLLRPRPGSDPLRWDVAASPGTSWLRMEFAAATLRPGRHAVTVSRRGARTPLATFTVRVGR